MVVAVKSLREAKQRLQTFLTQQERSALALAMLEDVLAALVGSEEAEEIAVVSCDDQVFTLARRMNLTIIAEGENRGETAAIELATQWYAKQGARSLLRLPGDVPLITPEDVNAIFRAGRHSALVLVPSRDGLGTNALLRRPPDIIPVRFGGDSFRFHLENAQRVGANYQVLRLPRLELDIDTPDDLMLFAASESRTRTYCKLQELEWPLRYRYLASKASPK